MLNISQTFNISKHIIASIPIQHLRYIFYTNILFQGIFFQCQVLEFRAKCQAQEAWQHWQQFGALISEDRAERTQRSSEEAHIED